MPRWGPPLKLSPCWTTNWIGILCRWRWDRVLAARWSVPSLLALPRFPIRLPMSRVCLGTHHCAQSKGQLIMLLGDSLIVWRWWANLCFTECNCCCFLRTYSVAASLLGTNAVSCTAPSVATANLAVGYVPFTLAVATQRSAMVLSFLYYGMYLCS
jgi:hypothetical protein